MCPKTVHTLNETMDGISSAVIIGSSGTLSRRPGWDLPEVDELSRLVEGYVLHDRSFYFPERDPESSHCAGMAEIVDGLSSDNEIAVSVKYDPYEERISSILEPYIDDETKAARRDYDR